MLQLATMVLEKTAERRLVTGLRRCEQGRLVGRRVRDRVCHRFVAGLNGHDVSISSVRRQTSAGVPGPDPELTAAARLTEWRQAGRAVGSSDSAQE
ncbi:MAG: hypothetical protein ACLPY3_28060 [Solirubrobacteraceae bacterium]